MSTDLIYLESSLDKCLICSKIVAAATPFNVNGAESGRNRNL